jgi:glycosyltransferase involved in cell wall biosynthesis
MSNAPDNVLFTDRVKSVCQALSAATIFVFPSYEENQGIAALEAAACGLPLIMRDLSTYSEFENGKSSVKFATIEELASAITELVTNPAFAHVIGRNAKEITQEHDVRTICKKLLRVYLTAKQD